ncbi:hypothetical protein K9L67_03250 [Candidatus Woesearchaeota archaeon]|nr:hypothetical protein [Candidatus Woesearchaeota archaeon]MCF7901218.1 hypothetical protein [Candidatus Woesearchaeota archaeon]MCF8013747.1 hypothetical protein [Candidatus Woesearchaeota archaeon]
MAKPTATLKRKKKVWYSIHAPKLLNNDFLGETYVYDKEQMQGKTLKLNLSTITGNIKKQNMDISFEVTTVVDNKAITKITGVTLTNSYIKRLVRRGRDKIDDSFSVKTKDNKIVRIKPFATTMNKTSQTVNSKIRLAARSLMAKYVKNKNFEEFFFDVMNFNLQKEMKEKLSKIYPIKSFEVRNTHLEPDNKKTTIESEKENEELQKEEKKAKKKKLEPEPEETTETVKETQDESEDENTDDESDEEAEDESEENLESDDEENKEEADEDNPKQ